MTTEEKFNAAVNVIRSLPKNGSYQPSNDLMLRFYAYYKQATQGPCTGSRPAFWDVVSRVKYDAWKKLGNMSKEEAMAKYVDELHTIVETMSYSDKVANFLKAPTSELDRINIDDLELIAGDVIERVRSQPNSPIGSREASPIRYGSRGTTPSPSSSIPLDESDRSDDEYIDTIENPEPRKYIPSSVSNSEALPNGYIQYTQTQHISRPRNKTQPAVDISQEVSKAVQSLKADVERLTNKINSMENSSRTLSAVQKSQGFFGGVSPPVIVFILLWPFVVNLIMNRFTIRRY